MKAFLRWWLLFCLYGLGAIVLFKLGLFHQLYEADASKLSFVILSIFSVVTAYIGMLTYRMWKNIDIKKQQVDACWFFGDSLTTVGMIGTVIGFLMMLGTAFANLDVSEVNSIQEAITSMALGMSTALTTTLTGMICSLLVKLQLVNLDEEALVSDDEQT